MGAGYFPAIVYTQHQEVVRRKKINCAYRSRESSREVDKGAVKTAVMKNG
jgi:hypothetical protein